MTLSRSKRKHLVSSLRSFLRFAHVTGMIERNLVEAVPVITIHKLASLTRGISCDAVKKLLAAPDRQTADGRRDSAILLIVATYGVRIGQVTHMRLRDIDWHHGLIHFQASKWGKPLSFPLNPAVAEAILERVLKVPRQPLEADERVLSEKRKAPSSPKKSTFTRI